MVDECKKGTHLEVIDSEQLDLGYDLAGPVPESMDKKKWLFHMHEKNHGLRATIGMKDKTGGTCFEAFREATCRIRQMASVSKRQVVRVHSDFDKSFESEIKKYVMNEAWLRTRTEGYDHDGNSVTERSIRRIRQANRTLLLDCTGGRQQYRELGVAAVERSTDISNYLAESGGTSPVQKAGGEQLQRDKVLHVFGSKVL